MGEEVGVETTVVLVNGISGTNGVVVAKASVDSGVSIAVAITTAPGRAEADGEQPARSARPSTKTTIFDTGLARRRILGEIFISARSVGMATLFRRRNSSTLTDRSLFDQGESSSFVLGMNPTGKRNWLRASFALTASLKSIPAWLAKLRQ